MRTMDVARIKHQEATRRIEIATRCPHHAVDEAYPTATSWVHHYCTHPDRVKEHPASDNAGLRVCKLIHEGHCSYGEPKTQED